MRTYLRLLSTLALIVVPVRAQERSPGKPDRVIRIAAERFLFSPSKVRVRKGNVVELVLSSDDTDHGFRIPRANIDVAIPPQGRGEVRIRFVAAEAGEYIFECSRPCGAGHNLMRGRILVE